MNKGIKIRIGTDCKDGGKAFLSELLLLYKANFSIEEILQIATINGAKAINLYDRYGSINTGKKADLIIFEEDPFIDYRNFLSKKVIIKCGKMYNESNYY